MRKRLLVVGGTGYLGSAVLRQALTQGWQVFATYHSQLPTTAVDITWQQLDIRDAPTVAQAVSSLAPDVVINTAYRQNDPDMWAVTAQGAQHVARATAACQARLLHLSSDVVFDGEQATPYNETDPPQPISAYGAAKADAERLVLAEHPGAVLVRTSLIYGFAPVDVHTTFILRVADGQVQARLFRDEYRCPIFVGDLAAALLELATHSYEGVLHVAGTSILSRYAFGVLLAQFYGRDPARIESGLNAESTTPRPRNCALDVRRAQGMLRTSLRRVEEVLAAQQRSTVKDA